MQQHGQEINRRRGTPSHKKYVASACPSGGKALVPGERGETVSVCLTVATVQQLAADAFQTNAGLSRIVRKIIEAHYAKKARK